MSGSIAEAFCLKTNRRNFQINVRSSPDDRKVYFGEKHLNDDLIKSIRQSYAMGIPPKRYLYGLYGAGKTHTLYNVKYRLEEEVHQPPFNYTVRCKIIECEFRKKTDFTYLHSQMMDAIGLDDIRDEVRRFLQANATQNLQELLKQRFADPNIVKAIHNLALGASDVTLWKWLCGGKLAAGELGALGLTKNLDTAHEMVTTLVGITRLFQLRQVNYLFMLDELEGLRNVEDRDAQESIHDGVRKLAQDDNDAMGFIVSFLAGKEDEIAEFIMREDIINRIGRGNIHDLSYLQETHQVETFLRDLFSMLIDPAKRAAAEAADSIPGGLAWYPMTDAAKVQFVDTAVRSVRGSGAVRRELPGRMRTEFLPLGLPGVRNRHGAHPPGRLCPHVRAGFVSGSYGPGAFGRIRRDQGHRLRRKWTATSRESPSGHA